MLTRLVATTNPLFELARTGKRLPHVVLAVVLGFAFVIGGSLAGGLIGFAINSVLFPQRAGALVNPAVDSAIGQDVYLICAFGTVVLLIALWMWLFEKRPFWTVGLQSGRAFAKYARGAVIGLLLFTAAVGLSAAPGYMTFEQGVPSMQGLPALGGVLIVTLGWIVQGGAEEILTRGWLMQVIGARYRPWLGVLISSIVFAVLHSLNPNLNVVAIGNLFLFGAFTALYALREGSVWGVAAVHAAWNWAQGNLFGLQVSGNDTLAGTLFNLMETGPDAITGGAFGPEGGLAVTAVLLIGCVAVALWQRQSRISSCP